MVKRDDLYLESTSSSTPEDVKKEADTLTLDLLDIINRNLTIPIPRDMYTNLIQDLCIYIVDRDIRILKHVRKQVLNDRH